MLTAIVIALVIGYLVGSLPFGYLVARARGVNIFEVGSKSPGATNVRRVLGHGPGNLVMLLDGLKGAVAAGWPLALARSSGSPDGSTTTETLLSNLSLGGVSVFDVQSVDSMAIAGLFAALIGHSFSCFTRFRGGKSIAAGAGGFVILFPVGALIAITLFAITLAITRYTSLGSMLAAVSLPISAFFLSRPPEMIGLCGAAAIFVIFRHRANISRLLADTESKVTQKPEGAK